MTVARYLLDSNHLTYLLQGHPSVLAEWEALPNGAEVVLSPITVNEVRRWLSQRHARAEDVSQDLADLQRLISSLPLIPLSLDACCSGAEVWVSMRDRGQRRPDDADCLLLGQAASAGYILVTADRQMLRDAARQAVAAENWYVA
jgi:predicted nucleic acid-binding protein